MLEPIWKPLAVMNRGPSTSPESYVPFAELLAALWPLYCVSKILGLAPFSVEHNSTFLKVHFGGTLDSLWSLLMCLLVSLGGVFSLVWSALHDYPKLKPSVVITDALSVFLQFSSSLVALVYALANRTHLETLLSKLREVSLSNVVDHDEIYRRSGKALKMHLTAKMVSLSLLFSMAYYLLGAHDGWIMLVPKHVATYINATLVFQFVTMTLLLKRTFKGLNELLEEAMHHARGRKESVAESRQWLTPILVATPHKDLAFVDDSHVLFRDVRGLHSQLHEVSEMVNAMFGLPLCVCLAADFMSLISSLHIPIGLLVAGVEAQGKKRSFSILLAGVILSWALLFLAKMVLVSSCGQRTSDEANRTVVVVHRLLLNQNVSSSSSDELRDFALQLANNRVEFSACRFFSVNHSFLCGILGATTTYLVILLQFS